LPQYSETIPFLVPANAIKGAVVGNSIAWPAQDFGTEASPCFSSRHVNRAIATRMRSLSPNNQPLSAASYAVLCRADSRLVLRYLLPASRYLKRYVVSYSNNESACRGLGLPPIIPLGRCHSLLQRKTLSRTLSGRFVRRSWQLYHQSHQMLERITLFRGREGCVLDCRNRVATSQNRLRIFVNCSKREVASHRSSHCIGRALCVSHCADVT
jgi:hypothetical protein